MLPPRHTPSQVRLNTGPSKDRESSGPAPRRRYRGLLALSLGASVLSLAACKPAPDPGPETVSPDSTTPDQGPVVLDDYALGTDTATSEQLAAKVLQFVPVELHADLTSLPESEQLALAELIEAAKLLDPIFDRQVWAEYPRHEQRLIDAASAEGAGELERRRLEYFEIMRGPWDRQDHFAPFAIDIPHPPGAGFYPPGLGAEEFQTFAAANPEMRGPLENLFTVVQRDSSDPTRLTAVPYSVAYSEWLEPAAARLRSAADLTQNASLATFLRSRADAFASDDYYQSDKDWMDLDSGVEITIGPYETYEDELLGLKASFEAFVTISDPEASRALAGYKDWLPRMEQHLPVPKSVKTKRGAESPIRVVDLVYTSGDARKSVQTIAFNLPNDERVRREKGAKKVMLRNAINAKFDVIMTPIAARILDPKQLGSLSQSAFFNEVLFHELSHSLGPATVTIDGREVEVRVALGASYSPLEEGKADVMGAWNVLFMIDKGQFKGASKNFREELLVTYFAGLFRSARFGVAEAHGKGAAFQINRFLEEGAASFDTETGRFSVDTKQLEKSIEALVHDIVMLQHEGDKAAVDAFLAKYGVMSPAMDQALGSLDGIPVDIKPIYTTAGE